MIDILKPIFSEFNLWCLFGFSTWFIVFITRLLRESKRKKYKSKTQQIKYRLTKYGRQFFTEFVYTGLSIILGLTLSISFEVDNYMRIAISICCGLFGSSIIRKFIDKRDLIADKFTDKISDGIIDGTVNGSNEGISTKINNQINNQNQEENGTT